MEHVCSADGIPAGEKRVSSCAAQLHLSKGGFAEVSQERQRQQDLDKMGDSSTANCFTLRKQILELKLTIRTPSRSTFTLRFPQVGPWHHISATMKSH